MNKKVKKILIGTTIGAAALAGTAAAVVHLLSALAINRNLPGFTSKLKSKLSGEVGIDGPEVSDAIKAIETAAELETETVKIKSSDGLTLTGHVYPAENAKRILIAMHGWRSNWSIDFGASYEFYHNAGCTIIFPDQRSTGESEGDYIGFGVLERHDCLDWINYAVERFGTDKPIYLAGVSMGATTVLMTLGFSLPDCIHGVIADCGFISPHTIWSHVMNNNLRVSDRLAYPIVNLICNKKARFDGDEYSTLEALKNNEIPVLFIHGGDDKFVPIRMTFDNYEACTADKDLLVVPSAAHGMSCIVDKHAYEQAVTNFFCKHD